MDDEVGRTTGTPVDLDAASEILDGSGLLEGDDDTGGCTGGAQAEVDLVVDGDKVRTSGGSCGGEGGAGDVADAIRAIAGEEELLLFAVDPAALGRGIGGRLLERFAKTAELRGSQRLFLEMRDGNPAASLYHKAGFSIVGRRRNYYRRGTGEPRDAITFASIL